MPPFGCSKESQKAYWKKFVLGGWIWFLLFLVGAQNGCGTICNSWESLEEEKSPIVSFDS
jgi:hypothetical protein